jgi:hypothetical protein
VGVGEIRLVEHNVSGDEDSARGEATIPLVVRGVTEKHTTSGAGRQLVRSSGSGVRVTSAPEDTKVIGREAQGQRGLDQKGAHDVVRGPNHALSLAVLWGGIQTRHAQLDTPREEEGTRGVIVELTSVVTLDNLNGEAELSSHPGKEVEEGGKRVRLSTQRESPGVVREIIDHY